MADIIYRAARATDAHTIAAIHVASWRDAYRSILDPAFLAEPVEEDRLSHWLGKLDTPALNFMVRSPRRPMKDLSAS